jgi:hypothetical protein
MADPFHQISGLTIEYVDAAAGSRKTLTAVAVSLERAREEGVKTIFCMPTLRLVEEMVEVARRPGDVPVIEITSREDEDKAKRGQPRRWPTTALLYRHIRGRNEKDEPLKNHPTGGHLVFITHETYYRMRVWPSDARELDLEAPLKLIERRGIHWPPETRDFEIVIDEVPEVILTRQPFKLHDNSHVLTSFLDIEPATVTAMSRRARAKMQAKAGAAGLTIFTERDARMLLTMEAIVAKGEVGSSPGEVKQAQAHVKRLRDKQRKAQEESDDADMPDLTRLVRPYCQVRAKNPDWLMRRIRLAHWDDIYGYLQPIPDWLATGASLFVDWESWVRMVSQVGFGPLRGRLTISGFRRPEALRAFKRATIMSALFQHTMLHDIWSQLGVHFEKSTLVNVSAPTTRLGDRQLRIYWLTNQGWSKRMRDRSGGIGAVFDLIIKAGVLDPGETVCIVTNKDDASEDDPAIVRQHFAGYQYEVLPHNSKGQNRFRRYHQLIHCAALNAYTPDIRWLETALGIDSHTQRIARTGQDVYQTLMRLSLRDPRSAHDVTLVVMDKDVAEWLPQWFTPADQVEVIEIDSSGVVRRKKTRTGRPSLGDRPMTNAERQRLWRQRRREQDQP